AVTGYESLDSAYKPASKKLTADIYMRLNSDGTIRIDTGAYVGDGQGYRKAKNVYNGSITGASSIGVFAVTDTSSNINIHVRGQLNGKMTIANLGHGNIYLDSSVTYKDTSSISTNLLGLVAKDTIYITDDTTNCQNPVTIDAAVLATTFTAQHVYNNDAYGNNASKRLFTGQPNLYLKGSLAQYSRGVVGASNSSNGQAYGFKKNYTYDSRFAGNVGAQGFPTLAYFAVASWYESIQWSRNWWDIW
ncbi:MAG TPA: hypothetical protein VMU30_05855, partial [Bacteroidota bacterium]|nr:hypothetical protein [Bacteroidota bacterium]